MLTIKKIMYKPPATIVFWNDGTKTVSVCEDGDEYNKELGFALCVLKKKYGNKTVHEMLERYVHNATQKDNKSNSIVWEYKPALRSPKVHKKRIKVNRPLFYLTYIDDNAVDGVHEEECDINELFDEIYKLFTKE